MNKSLVSTETLLLYFLVLSTSKSVQCPPKMLKQPPAEEIMIRENESLVLKCEAEGKPLPEYRWTKNGETFTWQNNSSPITQKPGSGTLNFTRPTVKDEGRYQCFARNSLGTATSNSVTVVKSKLKPFKTKPVANVRAQEGEPFGLFCDAPAIWPKPTVFWVKTDQKLDGKFFAIADNRMTVDPNGTLWISYLRKSDTSNRFTYFCQELYGLTILFGNGIKLNVTGSDLQNKDSAPVQQYVTGKNETVVLGKTVELFCIYGGHPLPRTVWLKDGSAVRTDKRVKTRNYGKSLLISKATVKDRGTYSCDVSNGVGPTQSYDIKLDVTVVPYFTISPEVVEKAAGDTAVIGCEANGNPEPAIEWIHNGRPLSEAPPNPRRFVTPNSITISELTESDAGNYGCNASNGVGYVYKDVYITLSNCAATITEFSHNVETVNGNSVIFKCKHSGLPKPSVKWTRNDTELLNGRYSTQNNGDLQISHVDLADSGHYTCIVSNSYGTASATGKLDVKERTRITSKPDDTESAVGTTVTFHCEATADRSLSLTVDWSTADGIPVRFDGESRFRKSDDNSMTIAETVDSDSGTYTCLARTELDNASASARLIVQDKPNRPQLLDVTCNDRNAVIEWQPNGDNRAPILNYTVEYNTSLAPDTWSVVSDRVPGSDRTYNVSMTPWVTYTFRVIAANKIGSSTPSSGSRECVSKPDVPYDNPENVEAAGTEPDNLVISWTPMPKIKHNAPGLGYRVFWKLDRPGQDWTFVEIADYADKKHIVCDQPSYQRYKVKIVAFNEIGESKAAQKKISGYSGEGVPVEAPQNLTVLNVTGSRSAILSWKPVLPDSVRGNFKGYKIQFWIETEDGEKNASEEKVGPNSATAEIKSFTPNSTNYVHVLAYNGRFDGPPSQFVHFDTPKEVDDGGEQYNTLITAATLGLSIGTILFALCIVISFINICVVKRSRRKNYKPGDPKHHNSSGEPHLNESFKPLVEGNRPKSGANGVVMNESISMKDLDETGESELEGMNEDGSFIGVYNN